MPMKDGYCIIVDGYSTGKAIPPLLRNAPYDSQICLHIKSSPRLPPDFHHKAGDYAASFNYDGENLNAFIDELRAFVGDKPINGIFAGSEAGVELTDLLNERFNLPGNDPLKSELRRNKYVMNEAVKGSTVNTVEQCIATDSATIIAWSTAFAASAWPIVLKPCASQSADHVFFCHKPEEIVAAFDAIKNAPDMFGQDNGDVLAQTFNDGQEYIVNTVSHASQHWVAEIWRIHKRPQSTIYEYAELIDSTAPQFIPLRDATFTLLDIVGTRNGAGTSEFKYSPTKGPVLLETTSRPMGNAPLAFTQAMLGYTQVSVMLEALLDKDTFLARLSQPEAALKHDGLVAVLIADATGPLQKDINDAFCALTTYQGAKIAGTVGTHISQTIDSLTAPGEVYFIGTQEAIHADYQQLRRIEEAGLYRDAIAPPARPIASPLGFTLSPLLVNPANQLPANNNFSRPSSPNH